MKKIMNEENNKGFSLVELIVVIAIMAVLIGILAPQFLGYVDKTRQSADVTNAQELATEIAVKIADAEADGTLTPSMMPTTYTEISANVVASVPAIKAADGNWYYMVGDDGRTVYIAIGTSETITNDNTRIELYPKFGGAASTTYDKVVPATPADDDAPAGDAGAEG